MSTIFASQGTQSTLFLTLVRKKVGLLPLAYEDAGKLLSPSAESRKAVVSYWRKFVHEVLDNSLGGLTLPRKNVVRLTGHSDMTIAVYRGLKVVIGGKYINLNKITKI